MAPRDTRFSNGNTPGYRSGVTSRSTLGSEFYFNERNSGSGFHSQSEYPSQSPPLWSPFDQHRNVNTQADPYGGYDFVGPTPMQSQGKTYILQHATHEDLFLAQNPTYMRLYEKNMKLVGALEQLQQAYETLATSCGRPWSHTPPEPICDTPPLNPKDYPKVEYWTKKSHRDAVNEREEFGKKKRKGKSRRGRRPRGDVENVCFWHFQYEDSTVLDGPTVAEIRRESKKIWRRLCRDRPIGAPWSSVDPTHQMKFIVEIEAKFPLLRLCDNHYKAESIAYTDYSHWYDNWHSPEKVRARKRKRKLAACSTRPRKSQRRSQSSQRTRSQVENEEEEHVEESSEDEDYDGGDDRSDLDDDDESMDESDDDDDKSNDDADDVNEKDEGEGEDDNDVDDKDKGEDDADDKDKGEDDADDKDKGEDDADDKDKGEDDAKSDTPNPSPRRWPRISSGSSSSSDNRHDTPPTSHHSSPQPTPRSSQTSANRSKPPKARMVRKEKTPVRSTSSEDPPPSIDDPPPEDPPSPPDDRPPAATTSRSGTEAPDFNPNPLANITRKTPLTDDRENMASRDNEVPPPQRNPTGSAPPRSTSQTPSPPTPTPSVPGLEPQWATLNNGVPPSSSSSESTGTSSRTSSEPAGTSSRTPSVNGADVARGSAVSTTKGTSKSSAKMRPTKANTARNLYAIDYMKTHPTVTRDEFRDVWDNLDKTTKDSYKQREKDAKKNPTAS